MNFQLYLKALVVFFPVVASGCCITITGFSAHIFCTRYEKNDLKQVLVLYLSMAFLLWITIFCYVFYPKTYVFLNLFSFTGFVLMPILFYRLISRLIRLEYTERISLLHYIIPLLIGLVFLIWSLFVPFNVQMDIVMSKTKNIVGEYAAYSRLYTLQPILNLIFSIVYGMFIIHMLIRYYRRASSIDSTVCNLKCWTAFLVAMSLIAMIASFMWMVTPRDKIIYTPSIVIAALTKSAVYIALTCNILCLRYRFYAVYKAPEEDSLPNKKNATTEISPKRHSGKLTHWQFNAYLREQKPYLNVVFKITDAAEAMGVNRSVISAFINKYYGVNFNRFVNKLRLKEFERLCAIPSNIEKNITQLISKAGFPGARQYYRTLAAERGNNDKALSDTDHIET